MSTQTVIHDLRGPFVNSFEKRCAQGRTPDLTLEKIAGKTGSKVKGKVRSNFLRMLFTRRSEGADSRLEREEMPPFVVYAAAGSYTAADNHRQLAEACRMDRRSVPQAEI
jgi:hypothetical protein